MSKDKRKQSKKRNQYRKDNKNRNGPMMRSHDRSPVIVRFVTLPPVYAELSSIISSSQYFSKTVTCNGNRRRVGRRLAIRIFCIAISVMSTKPQVIAKSFI